MPKYVRSRQSCRHGGRSGLLCLCWTDTFHSLLKYIFDSLRKSKDKELVCQTSHIHMARIFRKDFLRLQFFVAWYDAKSEKDILLKHYIWSEGTAFRSDFFHSLLKYISVPYPIWGCKIVSFTSLKDFLSNHAMKTKETFKKIWPYECVTCDKQFIFLYFFEGCQICTRWMKKVLIKFCPFRPYTRMQNFWYLCKIFHQIMQQTKNEDTGNLQEKLWPVTNNFFIFTLSKAVKYDSRGNKATVGKI